MRSEAGDLQAIVEEKDASPEVLMIDEINSGVFALELPSTWEILEDFAILTLEPLSAPQPYRFERSYTERLTRRVLAAKLALSKGALRHGVPVPRTRGIVFISRVSFGLANLLATLEAEEDWHGVLNAGS